MLTGAEHMRQRKLLLPPFHGERMREYEEVMVEATRARHGRWPVGRPMRMQQHTRAITLEVILRAVFGVEAERMGPLKAAIGDLFEPAQTLTVLRAALSRPSGRAPRRRHRAALERLDALRVRRDRAPARRGEVQQRTDILSLLLGARDEDGEAMTDAELRDELVTLLLAGHETTATSVAWALERLVRHPHKLARLIAEIDAGEGDEYLTAVINETLRVRPVVPIVVRMLQSELRSAATAAARDAGGAVDLPDQPQRARLPRTRAEFRPERFLEAAPETFSWIPFGGGIRRCIGASFAQLEMKVMLRTMLSELRRASPTGGRGVAASASAGARSRSCPPRRDVRVGAQESEPKLGRSVPGVQR